MVDSIINEMVTLIKQMQDYINQDIEDIKQAKHEELLTRNSEKEMLIEKITSFKQQLNEEIVKEMESGVDVNIYRSKVDNLEAELRNLYELNRKLALIVQPIQQMYKEIVDEITQLNGGQMFDVKA
ncbi:hypothetical protein [Halarcobacter bivalviorum]|uniref:Uncharacterized protein n=1 Tax=Halarcobacter bivalviorum TaxID=663364 RepID=A0AAX2A551_9BACT|nr:hypothetical protein [Halarcobacter bivalviorum]AXH11489.1 hypothetical protein ABIV_0468 [Halarcobacter bivalviorum]RXK09327.1 hypothetical protein CRV05_10375 [Halarcobacter bivalviorum]